MYADDLVLYDKSEEDMRAMVEQFVEVCRRRGLKVNTGRSLVNARDLQLECARFLHETLFVAVLTYGSETLL